MNFGRGSWLDSLSNWLGIGGLAISCVGLVVMTGTVATEIVLRNLFNGSTHLSEVIQSYSTALITFGAMSYAMRRGAMIRAIALSTRIPFRFRLAAETFLHLLVLVTLCIFSWFLWEDFSRNFIRGTVVDGVIRVPQWIPSLVVLISTIMVVLQIVVQLGDLVRGVFPDAASDQTEY